MNVSDQLSGAIITVLEQQGLSRLDMVLKLAVQLDVRDKVYTADEHRGRLEKALAEDRQYSAQATKSIKIGETVMTDRGPARAVILEKAEQRLLEKLLGVSRGLAA